MPKDVTTLEPADDLVENTELVLFHAKECYVYLIPPRRSAASYRADEWDVNKWAWEGAMKICSKGEECTIRLEDKTSGELYAQASVRKDEPLPIERVIDSSRYFVLRIEDNSSGKSRHAFIGIGFRERPQAYDFEAALYDHVNYLNKKKQAEELEQEYQTKPAVDYSLKSGETIRLSLKKPSGEAAGKSTFTDAQSLKSSEAPTGWPSFPLGPSESLTKDDTKASSLENTVSECEDEFGDFQTA
ncbi:adaptin ear-binding coat-associated protein 1 isoform X1 [Selaginella moellendorffii]|uniref:adaptin ear-binding coat-associated protein 1 isoform X1 n=2 Tax=Selaginella moellendorffii TaxID=88036 RepID=UPI000D1C558F|nr:adaptin ear-binding coat-associated protein 1 isoform X1 [Selaginella moellendorffii]XP_024538815.1 adaptin ear-binding coat-associated protein 1 isoform X1 [Selaginella moellendorffii]|eukprot:XP_002978183.2 adaptin ear-binding coat-associated protein 1 isoform X1 [Selaginella moellendorffii]